MRIVKIILIVIVALILAVLSIGLIVPSFEYESSIEVNAPPEKCWKVYNDTSLIAQWLPGLESFKLTSGEPMQVGSTYQVVINEGSERMVMNETLTSVEAPSRISYVLTNDVLQSEFSFEFVGSSSTTIKSHYKITGNNFAWCSILFLSKPMLEESATIQLTGLKKVIEAQP